jgi:threonyl-tRNA synthetase
MKMNTMKITMPNGDIREYPEGISGYEIAKSISERLAKEAVGIIVNEKKQDLSTPINKDAAIRILTFEDEEGKQVFWHSSAHLMAAAIEKTLSRNKIRHWSLY